MKKLLTVLLVLCLLISMTACAPKEPAPGTEPNNNQTQGQSNDPEPTFTEEEETIDTALWTLTYDPEVWSMEEDGLYSDEDYTNLLVIIPDGEEDYEVNLELRASIEDAENFRDYLDSYGFDAYEYAENNAYELTNVGGINCLMQEGNYWGEPCLRYFGRVESAGMTVFLEIIGAYDDSRVTQFLSGLTFKVNDTGNVDFPWPWNGMPFSMETRAAAVGAWSVNSQWIPFDTPMVTKETFDHSVAVVGDTVYLLTAGQLKQYRFDGSSLIFQSDIALDGEYDTLQASKEGALWLSSFMEPMVSVNNGAVTASLEGPDYVAMAPDGTWGISWFTEPECEKIYVSGSSMTTEPIVFGEVDTIMHLMVDESYIYVCGSDVNGDHRVHVYDHSGALQMTLGDENGEGLGSITFMAKTANGFLGLDGNMRQVVLWSADGTFLGAFEDSDLFGTNYPWFCGGTKLSDGSILVIMTEERADQSAMELVAFKLTGF